MQNLGTLTVVFLCAASLTQAAVIPWNQSASAPLFEFQNNSIQQSVIPTGAILTHCTVPGTIALTFDDGPFVYTAKLLDTLAARGAHATFFLNGANQGSSIDRFPGLVARALAEGHQLGSHTWSHVSLTTLDYPAIVTQMTDLEAAFLRTVGFFPTYMRPPFLFFNDVVLRAMADLGYHVIGASIDTKDYETDHPSLSWRSFDKFRAELNDGGNIVLAHDTHKTTVDVLVDNMLNEIMARNLTPVTVGQCLGDPPEFWYRTGR